MTTQEWTFIFITITLAGLIPAGLAYYFENRGNDKGRNLSLYYAGLLLLAGGAGTVATALATVL